jgi:thermitase
MLQLMPYGIGSIVLFASLATSVGAAANPSTVPAFVPGEIIVGFMPGTPGQAKAEAHRQSGGRALRSLDAIHAVLVEVGSGNMPASIAMYENNPNVRYAEPNYLRPLVLPNEGNDPPPPIGLGIDYLEEQWALDNHGQAFFYDQLTGAPGAIVGTPGADIGAAAAWDLSTGSSAVTVAVLDSGVDCDHVDLAGKCLENINLGPSSTLTDDIGHGTHVAGIIAANTDNGIGVAGVGWNTTLAAIKVCYEIFDPFFGFIGVCDAAASAAGMIHAADMGYQVVNMSYAGPTVSQAEADAAAYAWANGVVLVAAAANDYSPNAMYPAAFPEVTAVAASDWHDNLAAFSNFGSWVSVAAPGVTIFSTMPYAACALPADDPDGCYGWQSGTSMASPVVAGAAALVWAHMGPGATNDQVRNAIEVNADANGVMGQNFLAWTANGRLNLFSALTNGGTPPPPPPPPPAGTHVGDLDGQTANQGKNWSATVTITAHDEAETPVSNRLVEGTWSGGHSGPASCITDTSGQCQVSTAAMPKKTGSVSLTVTDISGGDYQPSASHDPDGDSDGTSLTVTK